MKRLGISFGADSLKNHQPVSDTCEIEMRFDKVLTNGDSLFQFFVQSKAGSEHFYLAAGEAASFFDGLESIVYLDESSVSLSLQSSDGSGAAASVLDLQIAATVQSAPQGKTLPDVATVVFTLANGQNSSTRSVKLNGYDTLAFYNFLDDFLWSNPPNPPH